MIFIFIHTLITFMLKKTLLFLAVCLSLCDASLSARTVTRGNYVFDLGTHYDGSPYARIVSRVAGFNPSGELVLPGSVTVDGVTYPVTILGNTFNFANAPEPPVFSDLPELTSVVISNELTQFSVNEFENCPNITEYKVKSGNAHYYALNGSLYETYTGMATMRALVRYPAGRKATRFTLPEDVNWIGPWAFLGNKTLKTIVLSGYQYLYGGWQAGNKSICEVDVSQSTYYNPQRSKNGFLIKNDEYNTLDGVAPGVKMEMYTIPSDILRIDDGAFCNSSIRNVLFHKNITQPLYFGTFFEADIESITLPGGKVDDRGHTCSSYIYDLAFYNCKKLTKVTLSANDSKETIIGSHAFYGCSKLSKISIASSAPIEIGTGAFSGCTSLPEISMPTDTKISFLGSYAFADCKSLKSFSLANVKELGINGYTFAGSGLTAVNWPSTFYEVPKGSFKDCTSLKEISLKKATGRICEDAFRNTGIETLNLMGVEHLEKNAFADCLSLRKIVVPYNEDNSSGIDLSEAFTCNVDGTQLIINTPLYPWSFGNDIPMKFKNVDVFISINEDMVGEDDIALPYDSNNGKKSNWKSVNVPAYATESYQKYSKKTVKEMFSYYNNPTKKTATVTSLNPLVSITGVTIEGVAATKNGNTWSAPKAVLKNDYQMHVTIDYTVNGAKMSTRYSGIYAQSANDDIMSDGNPGIAITLYGRTADFGTDASWSVHTMQGSTVASGRGRSADLRQLPSGIYVIRAGGSTLKTILY